MEQLVVRDAGPLADDDWKLAGLFAIDLANVTGVGPLLNRLLPFTPAAFVLAQETKVTSRVKDKYRNTLKQLRRLNWKTATGDAEVTAYSGYSAGVMSMAKGHFGLKPMPPSMVCEAHQSRLTFAWIGAICKGGSLRLS